MDKDIVEVKISINIKTNKPNIDIQKALIKGIHRGLDTEPNYIAKPDDIDIYLIEMKNIKTN